MKFIASAEKVPAPRGRPLGGPQRFTREVLDIIPLWVEMGATRAEIAAAVGTTVGYLDVVCSRYGISLRPTPHALRRALTDAQWSALTDEATRRGVPVWRLVADVVGAVVDAGKFSEVLK